jgi:hypothetical protein
MVVKKKKYDIISKYGNNVSRDAYFLRNSSTNKGQFRSSGDRCMSKKKEENEKQSLKPTPPLGYEVKFSQGGRVKIRRPFPRTPVDPIFRIVYEFFPADRPETKAENEWSRRLLLEAPILVGEVYPKSRAPR